MTPSAAIQPIVLVGGQSRRFGRDKLREPVGAGWLVDRPLRVLREVFGPRVAAVGNCDPAVRERFDLVLRDRYPGRGPIGGILSALEETGGEVFVLAGDLPRITAEPVRAILAAADQDQGVWAVVGYSTGLEPCVGLYRPAAARALRAQMERGQSGWGGASLHDALPRPHRVEVKVDPLLLRNANTPGEIPRGGDG